MPVLLIGILYEPIESFNEVLCSGDLTFVSHMASPAAAGLVAPCFYSGLFLCNKVSGIVESVVGYYSGNSFRKKWWVFYSLHSGLSFCLPASHCAWRKIND
jgi:hypothetical protein